MPHSYWMGLCITGGWASAQCTGQAVPGSVMQENGLFMFRRSRLKVVSGGK